MTIPWDWYPWMGEGGILATDETCYGNGGGQNPLIITQWIYELSGTTGPMFCKQKIDHRVSVGWASRWPCGSASAAEWNDEQSCDSFKRKMHSYFRLYWTNWTVVTASRLHSACLNKTYHLIYLYLYFCKHTLPTAVCVFSDWKDATVWRTQNLRNDHPRTCSKLYLEPLNWFTSCYSSSIP